MTAAGFVRRAINAELRIWIQRPMPNVVVDDDEDIIAEAAEMMRLVRRRP